MGKKRNNILKSLTSPEILKEISDLSIQKANEGATKLFILAVMAGAYIAMGAGASATVSFNLVSCTETFGIGRMISACVFPVGLMMVLLCGAELFTGNNLMVIGLLDRKIKISSMLRNWIIVYAGNFTGAVFIAVLINYSGLLESGEGLLGAMTIKTAVLKTDLDFGRAVVLGIMCNWVVCLAVWMATGAQTSAGKILSILFCIGMFVISGFEHSVANMYFIPSGIIASSNDAFVQLAGTDISGLNAGSFLFKNLLPVTLGNIIGGTVFVGMAYWTVNRNKAR